MNRVFALEIQKHKSVTVISMLNIYISFNSQINFQRKKKTSPENYSMNILILCNRLFQHYLNFGYKFIVINEAINLFCWVF